MFRNRNVMFCVFVLPCLVFSKLPETNPQLDQLIRNALENNRAIMVQQQKVISQSNEIITAGSLPNPSLSAGYFISPVVTKEGPQEWKLGITQNLPWPGKLSGKEKIARLRLDIENEQLRQVTLQVVSDVRATYEQLRFLASEEAITNENFDILKQLESVIRLKYTTSRASQSYLLKVQMDLLRLEDDLISITAKRPVLLAKLNQLLGDTTIEDGLVFDNILSFEKDLPAIEYTGIEKNPQLLTAQKSISIGSEAVRLAKLSAKPDFSVGLDNIILKDGTGKNPLMVRAGISLPIWFGKNKAIKESANAKLAGADSQLQDVRLSLDAQLESLNYKLDDSRRKYNLYIHDLIPLAEQNYKVAESAYLSDEVDFETYLNSEKNLLQAKLEGAKMRLHYFTSHAEYLELTAQEF
ncbi:MAG: TolC family protein [Candidatus Marinimicrobia bacterium]|nr:TolC family protein [Candidatus Neomarinimicrobiota bacterium]